ncbi:hypothetical protein [Neptunicella sp. SCSIO 80796]|uniref:hypothetical protein n=1 Tax=Neptunicella plasticusilytica TaxID=3117012 RepID=UPI003A4D1F8E
MALADSMPLPPSVPEIAGFDCAKEVQQMIGLIGRGDNFPQFLATDIETELNRQHAGSKLLKMECIGEPQLKAETKPVKVNNEEKQAITTLSLSVPLEITVKGGKTPMTIKIEQNYLVENFDSPESRKLTQNFIVKE